MKKPFLQYVILAICFAGAGFAMLVFSDVIPIGNSSERITGVFRVWGTMSDDALAPLLETLNTENKTYRIEYSQFSVNEYEQKLVEALASGVGPDIFQINNEMLIRHGDKVAPIPYTSFPVATYKTTYIRPTDIFLYPQGLLAYPLFIDPLIMYGNKRLMQNNAILDFPKLWKDIPSAASVVRQVGDRGDIRFSYLPLGTANNVDHYKDIITTMYAQIRIPIIRALDSGSDKSQVRIYVTNLNSSELYPVERGSPIQYYTSYSNPNNAHYSWSAALPMARDFFAAEQSVFYIGRASDYPSLLRRNSNIELLFGMVPQTGTSTRDMVINTGSVHGLAVSKSSKNITSSYVVAAQLSDRRSVNTIAKALGLAPVYSDLIQLGVKSNTQEREPVVYRAAIHTQPFIDPYPEETSKMFQTLVNTVLSGSKNPDAAVSVFNLSLTTLLQ